MAAVAPRWRHCSRTAILQAIFIVAAIVIAWLLWHKDDTERLMDVGPLGGTQALLVSGDKVYWGTGTNIHTSGIAETGSMPAADPLLFSCPVAGGPPALVVRERPGQHFDTLFTTATGGEARFSAVTRDGTIFYVMRPRQASGVLSADIFPAAHILPIGRVRPAATSSRSVSGNSPVQYAPAFIHAAPAAGGSPREAARLDSAGQAALFQTGALWLRHSADRKAVFARTFARPRGTEEEFYLQVFGHCDLMLTMLPEGATRRIAAGLPQETRLEMREDGVFWRVPRPAPPVPSGRGGGGPTINRPRPQPREDLYYASAATGSVAQLGTLTAETIGPATEYRGRLYWFSVAPHTFGQAALDVLMSVRPDGSDARRELSLADSHRSLAGGSRMTARPDGIYIPLREVDLKNPDERKWRTLLCRVRPEAPARVEDVRQLPAGTFQYLFDRHYLYFTLLETSRDPWQELTFDSVGSKSTVRLCRVLLR